MSVCHSCGATVIWALTVKNAKRIPVDVAPTDEGNIELSEPDAQGVIMAKTHSRADSWPPRKPRYISHFATCPTASRHRR